MALSTEELLLQMQILTEKTDVNTNPNMVYKANKTLNKGLNPEYYSGNNTKIVNILNDLFAADTKTANTASAVADKVNSIIKDTDTADGLAAWEKLQAAMGKSTIIDGLNDLYEGKHATKVLGLSESDVNKVLTVAQDDKGNLILKAVEQIISGGNNEPVEVLPQDIAYTNPNKESISNVKQALDYVIDAVANNNFEGGLGGGTIVGQITWDMIDDRPMVIADGLVLTEDRLELRDGQGTISTVELMTAEDIEMLVEQLNIPEEGEEE